MIRRPPRSTRTDTLVPYTTLFRSFLMSRNYTLYAMLPRDEDRPAALVMPGSGVYHLEHAPTWMPNVATYLTRIDPRNIPERDFEVTTEEVDAPAPGPIMPYPTRAGVAMAPRDRQLLGRYAMPEGTHHRTAARPLDAARSPAGPERARRGIRTARP